MEQNPLEQEKNNQISAMREKVRHEIEELFMMTSEEQKRIFNKFVSKLDIYQENGLAFDKEKTKKGSSAKMEILD